MLPHRGDVIDRIRITIPGRPEIVSLPWPGHDRSWRVALWPLQPDRFERFSPVDMLAMAPVFVEALQDAYEGVVVDACGATDEVAGTGPPPGDGMRLGCVSAAADLYHQQRFRADREASDLHDRSVLLGRYPKYTAIESGDWDEARRNCWPSVHVPGFSVLGTLVIRLAMTVLQSATVRLWVSEYLTEELERAQLPPEALPEIRRLITVVELGYSQGLLMRQPPAGTKSK